MVILLPVLAPRGANAFITLDAYLGSYFFFAIPSEAKEPVPPTPEEYLYQKANREVRICGYSSGNKCRWRNLAKQLEEVIRRESGWGRKEKNYSICSYAGCGSGQGLIQLIVSTQKHCEEKLGRKINRSDPFDSIDCGIYLLENEGIGHWEDPKGVWGSGPY